MIDMLMSIVLPSLILMKLSDDQYLGATWALIIALIFPIGWGLFELLKYKKYNFIAILGLVSVLLTGGIGLLELDTKWLAIKEALIPALIGIAVLISTRTKHPLVRTLLYNPTIIDVDTVHQRLVENNNEKPFEARLHKANYLLSSTFAFSAVMNYILAKWIVTSPAGSAAFNEELGQLTIVSYPVIALPSLIMMFAIFYYIWKTIHGLTGLTLDEILQTPPDQKDTPDNKTKQE